MENRDISTIYPYKKNAKRHTNKQIKQVANSIREFGFNQPIVVDKKGVIIVGHGRYEASKALKMASVPVLEVNLTDDQAKAYRLADNKLNESPWEMDLVIDELKELELAGFDIDLTGFDKDLLIGADDKDDEVPEVPDEPISKLGDIYQLGNHRIMCGDSTKIEDVEKLMDGKKADMVFTDPPYNVDYGKGNNPRHKLRSIKNDNKNEFDWDEFVKEYLTVIFTFCDGNIYITMSDKELGHLQRSFIELGGKWASFIIWVKDRLVLSAKDYHSRHETILYGWKDGTPDRLRVEDRKQTDVWEIKRPGNSELHPTMKPIELIEKAVLNSSKQEDNVSDIFLGSGSTLIACEKTNRICYGMELDPKYVDVIIARWEEYTGNKAVKVS